MFLHLWKDCDKISQYNNATTAEKFEQNVCCQINMTTLYMGNGIAPRFINYSRKKTDEGMETMGVLFGKVNEKGQRLKPKN